MHEYSVSFSTYTTVFALYFLSPYITMLTFYSSQDTNVYHMNSFQIENPPSTSFLFVFSLLNWAGYSDSFSYWVLFELFVGWRRCGGWTDQVLRKNWSGYACCSSSQFHFPFFINCFLFPLKSGFENNFQFVYGRKFQLMSFVVSIFFSFNFLG